ncbi:hypothetical protein D2V17_20645 [Aurantiacibacter xanthus]|uniref:Uncharacterized protein n=1 Tax=Aurantiacibacter xanthus TaxID=1784712 RepID=A0A3A1NY43_9SPHN|nr:hypothetical protein [Aurantiacibacter xanthus]RIV79910.1 hypothetical protein D2V17_20645 [Aurantiacibacter xanthus]
MPKKVKVIAHSVALSLAAFALFILPAKTVASEPPTVEWLRGSWVFEGGKCSEGASLYLPRGRLASLGPAGVMSFLGTYKLEGDILTSTVFSETYGDLVEVERIRRVSANEMAADYPHNTNPDIVILPRRRCPAQPGPEPWYPELHFVGTAALLSKAAEGSAQAPSGSAGQARASLLPEVTEILTFDNPAECDSAFLVDFFERAQVSGGATFGAFGRVEVTRIPQSAGAVTERAALRAKWNGLTVLALEHVSAPDSEYTEINVYNIVFAEPSAVSGPVLGRLGFGVSRAGHEVEIYDPDTMMNPYYIALEDRRGGSELKCSF